MATDLDLWAANSSGGLWEFRSGEPIGDQTFASPVLENWVDFNGGIYLELEKIIFLKDSAMICDLVGHMESKLFTFIKRTFGNAAPIHPVENGMARRWVKQRLTALYPDLRNNPLALERAYRALGLEPRLGEGQNEAETVFELRVPTELN